jgi:hypothetical protein
MSAFDPEEMVRVMAITDNPEPIINFLCDFFGYERPKLRDVSSFEESIREQVSEMAGRLRAIMEDITDLGKFKEASGLIERKSHAS